MDMFLDVTILFGVIIKIIIIVIVIIITKLPFKSPLKKGRLHIIFSYVIFP